MSSFVAFEIGNAITKVVCGSKSKSNVAIKKYSLLKNSESVLMPDGSLNIKEIVPLLKKELKALKVRKGQLYITLSGKAGIVRLREFPLVPLKQLEGMLQFDAEQFLPYDVEAFAMDFRINQIKADGMPSEGEGKTEKIAEVMVAVHPRNLVEQQLQLANSLKLEVAKVTCYTDAIFTYFLKYILNEQKNILVVDVGAKSTHITMFQGKKYFANTTSDNGVDSIAYDYGMLNSQTAEEAKKTLFCDLNSITNNELDNKNNKKDKSKKGIFTKSSNDKPQQNKEVYNNIFGVATPSDRLASLTSMLKRKGDEIKGVPSSVIDSQLEGVYENIAKDIRRMVEFFKTRQFGYSVDEIYLIGGGANLCNLDEFLTEYHGIPVSKISAPKKNAGISEEDYNLLIPVIGTVLNQEVSI